MKLYFTITDKEIDSFSQFCKENSLSGCEETTYCLDSTTKILSKFPPEQVPHDCMLKWDSDYIGKMYRNEVIGRFNQGKIQWTLMNYPSFEPMIEVLMYGASRYDRNNWMKACPKKMDLLDSLQRHFIEIKEDNGLTPVIDHGSNLRSIGHLMCNAMFYSYWEQKTNGQFENFESTK